MGSVVMARSVPAPRRGFISGITQPVPSFASVAADALAAADNNARWCDAVCRSHGLATRFADDLWIALEGAPTFYPDVVTLAPGASVAALLPPAATGVKDSF